MPLEDIDLGDSLAKTVVTAVGRGRLLDQAKAEPNYAQEVDIPLAPIFSDVNYWTPWLPNSIEKFKKYEKSVFVSMDPNDITKGTCEGDSGGPLFVKFKNRVALLGVTTFTLGKCGSLSAFTSVPFYLKWIREELKKVQ